MEKLYDRLRYRRFFHFIWFSFSFSFSCFEFIYLFIYSLPTRRLYVMLFGGSGCYDVGPADWLIQLFLVVPQKWHAAGRGPWPATRTQKLFTIVIYVWEGVIEVSSGSKVRCSVHISPLLPSISWLLTEQKNFGRSLDSQTFVTGIIRSSSCRTLLCHLRLVMITHVYTHTYHIRNVEQCWALLDHILDNDCDDGLSLLCR